MPEQKEPRKEGVKHIAYKPKDVKNFRERRHLTDKHASLVGPTLDNPNFCMQAFPSSYQDGTAGFQGLSKKEYNQESVMTKKMRVQTIADQRNGMAMASLGDKNYKSPEYKPNFYHEGGLIAGSTN